MAPPGLDVTPAARPARDTSADPRAVPVHDRDRPAMLDPEPLAAGDHDRGDDATLSTDSEQRHDLGSDSLAQRRGVTSKLRHLGGASSYRTRGGVSAMTAQ